AGPPPMQAIFIGRSRETRETQRPYACVPAPAREGVIPSSNTSVANSGASPAACHSRAPVGQSFVSGVADERLDQRVESVGSLEVGEMARALDLLVTRAGNELHQLVGQRGRRDLVLGAANDA